MRRRALRGTREASDAYDELISRKMKGDISKKFDAETDALSKDRRHCLVIRQGIQLI